MMMAKKTRLEEHFAQKIKKYQKQLPNVFCEKRCFRFFFLKLMRLQTSIKTVNVKENLLFV